MSAFKPSRQIGVGGFEFGDQERMNIQSVIESNRLSYGPWSKKFEELFAKEHQCAFAVFTNSGTSALHMALAAMKERYGWHDGDEVIVPALTFIASSNVVLYNAMKPIFVDIDPRTYNMNPSKIEEALSDKTRAIMPVHLFGMPCDMDSILSIAEEHSLRIIEDSCETVFASYRGKKVGSFGDIGCFSTYMAHFLVTGVGGIATTNDAELAVIMRSYMNHGRDSIYIAIDDDQGASGDRLTTIIDRRFSFVRLGHSMRATELEAAIGVAQIEKREVIVKKRTHIAMRYTAELSQFEDVLQLPSVPDGHDHHFMMYPIVLKRGDRGSLVQFLEERGIETRSMNPLLNQPIYKKIFGDIESRYPVAEWVNKNGFYIGCHPYISDEEVSYVIDVFRDYFTQR